VAELSGGRFGPGLPEVYEQWDDFRAFAAGVGPDELTSAALPLAPASLGPPSPEPRQVFAIGLNYRSHAEETGAELPAVPATFTKFPSCITGPFDDVAAVSPTTDWEVELVVVVGRTAERVTPADAWGHVAGLTVGQDISDRTLQFAAGSHFSLGKSHPGHGPTGPWLVTPESVDDPDDLALTCSVNGETVQHARTDDMAFGVPALVAELSAALPLLPGDLIFTGTPGGVGFARRPPRFLRPGDVLESRVEGIGTMRTRIVAPPDR
jgi:2-keto-4-pentenoate hydratase/2-oxohepta-3-ene-1,7-dioic acid hydratase in catechol pathway